MYIRSLANEILDIGNVDLEIRVERTNRKKTISLQFKNNKLIIKTPRSVSKKTLVDLIKRKQRWIKQRAILNFEEQNLKNREFIDNDKFYFKGEEYRLSLILGRKESVKIEGGLLLVSYVDNKSIGRENIKRLLEDWYLKESIKILKARTEAVSYTHLTLPTMIRV